jgi:hypothetical protein
MDAPSRGSFISDPIEQGENPMVRKKRMAARCTPAEKELLRQVAQAMQRTPSAALRILVVEKAQALAIPHPHAVMSQFPLRILDERLPEPNDGGDI